MNPGHLKVGVGFMLALVCMVFAIVYSSRALYVKSIKEEEGSDDDCTFCEYYRRRDYNFDKEQQPTEDSQEQTKGV